MDRIDFNENFKGFEDKEDILIDTGILLALINEYDTWHETVRKLFENHVFNNDNIICMFINPCIQNEFTNLVDQSKPLEWYQKSHPEFKITQAEKDEIENKSIEAFRILIENKILIILDSNKESAIKQLTLYKQLGAADAVNISIVNEYGISFLTIDNRLVNNILRNISKLEDIHNIYYTSPKHKTY